jgi:hypothetical protein
MERTNNNAVSSDAGHLAMEHGLPLLRRDTYCVLADSADPMDFEQICNALPGTHASVIRALLDGLVISRDVWVDRHGRYVASVPVVQS